MNTTVPVDFGELYRKAFAESNPKKKLLLLHEVQRVLHDWEQADDCRARKRNQGDRQVELQRAAS